MKKLVLQIMVIFMLLFLNTERMNEYIFWIQGYTNISILMAIWILLLISFLIELLWEFRISGYGFFKVYITIVSLLLIFSLWTVTGTDVTRYYFEENGQKIIVVVDETDTNEIITFYYRDNYFFARQLASWRSGFYEATYEFSIEDDNLILEITTSHVDGDDIKVRVIEIPQE